MKLVKPIGDANFHALIMGNHTLYFSYETLVAIESQDLGRFMTDKNYSKATSRQLNALGGQWSMATPEELIEIAEQVSVQIAKERADRLTEQSTARRPKI